MLLLLGILLLLFLLLLPLGVLLLFLLLLLLGILLLFQLLLLLGVLLLLFLLLLALGVLLLFLLLSRRHILCSSLWRNANGGLDIRLNAAHASHIHHPNGGDWRGRTLANLLDVRSGKRAARIPRKCRLLPVERNRSRRRSRARHHGPTQNVRGRARGPGRGVCPGAQNAFPLRRNGRSAKDLDRSKLSRRYRPRILRHPAASGEVILRNGGHPVRNVPVRILDVRNRRVVPAGVVIVVDGGVIDHRVGIVHPREITPARLV